VFCVLTKFLIKDQCGKSGLQKRFGVVRHSTGLQMQKFNATELTLPIGFRFVLARENRGHADSLWTSIAAPSLPDHLFGEITTHLNKK
jgi:hypothetical protein